MRSRVRFFKEARDGPFAPPKPVDPRTALTAIGSTTFRWNLATDALSWGPNAAGILGVPEAALASTGRALDQAIEPEHGSTRAEFIRHATGADDGSGVPYRTCYALRSKADRSILIEETGRWYAGADGRPAFARGLVRAHPGLAGDTLSAGLKARAALLARIIDDVREAHRSRHALTLIVGALEPGDDADGTVAEVERRIGPMLRRRDSFAIYAPNRFALALASCPVGEAASAVERLCALVAGEPSLAARLRLGVAGAPDHALDAPELLRHAEEALAATIRDGALRWSIYGPGSATAPCADPEAIVLEALNGRRLALALEPVIDALTGHVVFAQGLVRLKTDTGFAPAAALAPAAEDAGLSLLLDGRMLELVADRLAAHPDERIALALSPRTLKDREWLPSLAAHLGARPGIESRLILQVPEAALRNERLARGRLDAMKALGVGIMLTEFGTGHAGLKHLRSLPLDMLRIDGAFVQALPRSTDDRLFLRAIIDLAQHCGIATVAEWVEDKESARLLAQWGVDYLQGSHCGAPMVAGRASQPVRRRAGAA